MKTAAPMISVVTPCYNSARFINRLQESLQRQDYRSFEWILVDDLSTDNTVDVLTKLPSTGDGGIHIYKLPQNSGGGVALGFGVSKARGEILIMIDHDDEIIPSAFSTVIKEWQKISKCTEIAGIFYRRLNPTEGRTIGEDLTPGTVFSMSWQANTKPSITDGFLALKTAIAKKYFNPDALEAICLSGVPLNLMTKSHKLLAGTQAPLLIYHRDNNESQTNFVRISRKTVYTYAKYIDSYDAYYFKRPIHWIRHVIAMIKFSTLVHNNPIYHHRFLTSRLVLALSFLLLPLGLLSALHSRNRTTVVDLPAFDISKLSSIDAICL